MFRTLVLRLIINFKISFFYSIVDTMYIIVDTINANRKAKDTAKSHYQVEDSVWPRNSQLSHSRIAVLHQCCCYRLLGTKVMFTVLVVPCTVTKWAPLQFLFISHLVLVDVIVLPRMHHWLYLFVQDKDTKDTKWFIHWSFYTVSTISWRPIKYIHKSNM